MQLHVVRQSGRVDRPAYVWVAIVLELMTGLLAIPVGWLFITDPTGASVGLPPGWIEGTVFATYLVPGLYLLFVNGFVMLGVAGLAIRRSWAAPWLTGALGVGLIVWILVEILVMPETMFLTWIFLATGFALGFVALFWLRRTDQLRVW